MSQKVKMHAKNVDNQYVQVYPETVASQVVVEATGQTLEQMVKTGNFGGGGVAKTEHPVITASVNGQTEFPFNDPDFLVDDHHVTVHLNGEFLHKDEEYTVVKAAGQMPKVVLTQGVSIGDKIHVTVEKGGPGGGGSGTITLERIIDSKQVFYVNAVGSDNNDGLTDRSPFKTIGKALSKINNTTCIGHTEYIINLADGVYQENIDLQGVANAIVYINGSGPNTIIEGVNPKFAVVEIHHVWYLNMNNLTIRPTTSQSAFGVIGARVSHMDTSNFVNVAMDFSMAESTGKDHGTVGVYGDNLLSGRLDLNFVGCNIPIHLESCNCNVNLETDVDHRTIVLYNSNVTLLSKNGKKFDIRNVNSSSIIRNEVNNGIIVESGLNENGRYIKYADGTLIIYRVIEFGGSSISQIPGSTRYSTDSTTFNFAHNFVDLPHVDLSLAASPQYLDTRSYVKVGLTQTTGVGSSFLIETDQSTNWLGATITVSALGRWK